MHLKLVCHALYTQTQRKRMRHKNSVRVRFGTALSLAFSPHSQVLLAYCASPVDPPLSHYFLRTAVKLKQGHSTSPGVGVNESYVDH